MLDIRFGHSFRNCAGVSRRDALKVGALTVGGLTQADFLRAQSQAAKSGSTGNKKS